MQTKYNFKDKIQNLKLQVIKSKNSPNFKGIVCNLAKKLTKAANEQI